MKYFTYVNGRDAQVIEFLQDPYDNLFPWFTNKQIKVNLKRFQSIFICQFKREGYL